ncbi:MAG: hypothetical protein IJ240_08515 [Clostridia bacterium]|nr:hypothetical protein [Clostridia bacterium]
MKLPMSARRTNVLYWAFVSPCSAFLACAALSGRHGRLTLWYVDRDSGENAVFSASGIKNALPEAPDHPFSWEGKDALLRLEQAQGRALRLYGRLEERKQDRQLLFDLALLGPPPCPAEGRLYLNDREILFPRIHTVCLAERIFQKEDTPHLTALTPADAPRTMAIARPISQSEQLPWHPAAFEARLPVLRKADLAVQLGSLQGDNQLLLACRAQLL